MGSDRWLAAAGTVAEPLLVLALASLATMLLTLPLIPTTHEVRVRLGPSDDAESLVALVRAEELSERVRLGADGALVLEGVEDVDAVVDRVGQLVEAGDPTASKVPHMERLLHQDTRALPASLALQTSIFLVAGWTMIVLRVRRRAAVPGVRWPVAVGLGLAGGMVAVVTSALIVVALEAAGIPVDEQDWVVEAFSHPATLLRLAPWIVVLGPLAEEVFFRGYVLRFLSLQLGRPAGLLISSAMFAVIHLNLSGLLVYMAIGCVLGWVYQRTGRLLAPIVAHITVNGLVMLATLVGEAAGG